MQKVILITGSNSGIGKETAKTLAKMGHKIIIHGRDSNRLKETLESLKAESQNSDIYAFAADLSLKSEIAKFAKMIESKFDKIDVLLHNAGAQFGSVREVTSEGHEKTFAINVLVPFLLTHLLMPLLQKKLPQKDSLQLDSKNMESKGSKNIESNGENARVIAVSSSSFIVGKFDKNDIEFSKNYSLFRAYGVSKRYEYWIMQKFAQMGINGVTFNTLEAGATSLVAFRRIILP
ncbi:SDR family NAD(P)-dependent oxidoreductase [Helicobacter saguini]|uniref:SDR family NAD(P)-dependent oxidoreductase n=1 Tax=Helicobacter saguini TaxID=1548018 RepID=A0A347W540_9HELI|nr:SDR family NAD(P)-dependent oxidoreductase [Helicobacter saguini]MWV61602.1 SDR family NAD(P)-dependent oxidoreductase [Helicobacter saguini]MWV67726.1 SDR family NAD(P)-dependent oxidoreductase [Helicobacter saguini]MWV70078.1 SDR family NAD(P)-dependent oxidoreductase [Helicobacter saguini]MWV72709.1 SDR family NAD(P)-dependent oxidoreductase [Helicobacter saguini]TLD92025.1 SDR family NAD(P)-dependent oxidoreductase [Helicobacter saguini]